PAGRSENESASEQETLQAADDLHDPLPFCFFSRPPPRQLYLYRASYGLKLTTGLLEGASRAGLSEPLSERQKKRRCPAQGQHEASAVRAERGPRALFGGAGLAEQPVDALGRIIGADIGLAGLDDAPVFGIVAALLL